MLKATLLTTMLTAIAMLCGCEELESLKAEADKFDPAQNADIASTDVPASEGDTASSHQDAIPIGSISWLGDNYSNARISTKITGASLNNDNLYTSYQPYSWPSATVKTRVDAVCCLFYERGGRIVGGKFDWWRAGGQGTKGLENVHNGYNGHSFPARGSRVYTMIVSVDGRQRSNIQACSWR